MIMEVRSAQIALSNSFLAGGRKFLGSFLAVPRLRRDHCPVIRRRFGQAVAAATPLNSAAGAWPDQPRRGSPPPPSNRATILCPPWKRKPADSGLPASRRDDIARNPRESTIQDKLVPPHWHGGYRDLSRSAWLTWYPILLVGLGVYITWVPIDCSQQISAGMRAFDRARVVSGVFSRHGPSMRQRSERHRYRRGRQHEIEQQRVEGPDSRHTAPADQCHSTLSI